MPREEEIIRRAREILGARAPRGAGDKVRARGAGTAGLSEIIKNKSVEPGDDCAVWNAGSLDLLLTADMFIEETHFVLPAQSYERKGALSDIGWKSLSATVSDIAACGGEPLGYLVSLGLPQGASDEDIEALTYGIKEAADLFDIAVWGGDVVSAEQWTMSVTAAGAVPNGSAITRSGARAGDLLVLSGNLGLACVGLFVTFPHLSGVTGASPPNLADYPEAILAIRRPVARVKLGRLLRESALAGALIDTSDSLAKSVRMVAKASGKGSRIDLSGYDIHREVEAYLGFRGEYSKRAEFLVNAAEDYELLFSITASDFESLKSAWSGRLSVIGEMTEGERVEIKRGDGFTEVSETGFEHF